MKKLETIFSVAFLVFVVTALNLAWAQERNLWVNHEVTAQIRALDREYFKGFDVYSAGVKEAPTALLFDINDDYHLPSRFWGTPLSEEEIVYAINRLDEQSPAGGNKAVRFVPRAINIVNLKGKVVGYVYTGLNSVLMDRKKDGRVTVYPPACRQWLPIAPP